MRVDDAEIDAHLCLTSWQKLSPTDSTKRVEKGQPFHFVGKYSFKYTLRCATHAPNETDIISSLDCTLYSSFRINLINDRRKVKTNNAHRSIDRHDASVGSRSEFRSRVRLGQGGQTHLCACFLIIFFVLSFICFRLNVFTLMTIFL